MHIYLALALFSLIILIYWIITELVTLLFRLTGLPDERARFQVISLLTGTGYTTKESEILLSNRVRRRLARITMLFGYVFNITVMSALINVFFSLNAGQFEHFYIGILIPSVVVAVIFIFMRVPRVRAWGDNLLMNTADRYFMRMEAFNSVLLLDYIGSDSIAHITLRHIPEEYRGKTLAQTRLRAETGILVMLVEHIGGINEMAKADTVFEPGDKLVVFGDYQMICKSFHAREHFSD